MRKVEREMRCGLGGLKKGLGVWGVVGKGMGVVVWKVLEEVELGEGEEVGIGGGEGGGMIGEREGVWGGVEWEEVVEV